MRDDLRKTGHDNSPLGHPSTLVFDPGPQRCIASSVRWLKRALPISGASHGGTPRFSNSQLTLHPFVGVLLALIAGATFAQYPVKPVRVVVPYAAGGPLDEVARVMGPRLTEIWGQQVLVDNRVGAGGSIGTEVVARAAPDGYTLLLGNSGPFSVNPSIMKKLAYDPKKDLVPVTLMAAGQMVLSVHPSLPVKSVKELAALARANPGRLNFGSIGFGNLTHLGLELLQIKADIRM